MFSISSIHGHPAASWRIRCVKIPGSTAPDRVPIIRPSRGVKPIVVSMLRPFRIAAIEQPLPKWQLTSFRDLWHSVPSSLHCTLGAVLMIDAMESIPANASLEPLIRTRIDRRRLWHLAGETLYRKPPPVERLPESSRESSHLPVPRECAVARIADTLSIAECTSRRDYNGLHKMRTAVHHPVSYDLDFRCRIAMTACFPSRAVRSRRRITCSREETGSFSFKVTPSGSSPRSDCRILTPFDLPLPQRRQADSPAASHQFRTAGFLAARSRVEYKYFHRPARSPFRLVADHLALNQRSWPSYRGHLHPVISELSMPCL